MFGIDDFLIGLAIAGAASAASAGAGAVASSNASAAQKDSAEKAIDLQREMWAQQQRNYEQQVYQAWQRYHQQRQDAAPWLEAGTRTLGQLSRGMDSGAFDTRLDPSQIANDPGFQFRMAEGQKALERSASARGMLNSGGALKSLARYSQGLASDEYQNAYARNQASNTDRFNRLATLAGVGQTAAQNMGSLGATFTGQMGNLSAQNASQAANYAGQVGNLYGAIGNANAAGAMGAANAFSGGMNSLGNLAMLGGMYGGYGGGGGIPTQQPMVGSMVAGRGWGGLTFGGG